MQQGHPHLTKENFLSGTEKKANDNTHTPNKSTFHFNQCYMFIAILEVLMDQSETKSIKA